MRLYGVSIESDEYTTPFLPVPTGRHLLGLLQSKCSQSWLIPPLPASSSSAAPSHLRQCQPVRQQKPESLLARFCPAACEGLTVVTALSLFHSFWCNVKRLIVSMTPICCRPVIKAFMANPFGPLGSCLLFSHWKLWQTPKWSKYCSWLEVNANETQALSPMTVFKWNILPFSQAPSGFVSPI